MKMIVPILVIIALFADSITAEEKCRAIRKTMLSCMNAKEDDLPKTANPDIEWITFSKSTIPSVKKSMLKNFPKITDFHAEGVSVETVEKDAFINSKSLNWVDLSSNKIKSLDADLLKGLIIDHFNMSGNTKLSIPKNKPFLNSDKLKWLDISACEITDLYTQTFENLPALRDLSLARNELKTLPDDIFRKNPLITSLDITGNKFKTLSSQVFSNIRALVIIARFEDNPWDCDCNLTPLLKWSKKNVVKGDVKCDKPVKGKKWVEMVDPQPCKGKLL